MAWSTTTDALLLDALARIFLPLGGQSLRWPWAA